MPEIQKLFLQAKQNVIQEYEREKLSLLDKLKDIEKDIIRSADNSHFSPNSILKMEQILLDEDKVFLSVPYVLRMGELTPTVKNQENKDIIIPAFLPFARSNATCFLIDNNEDKIQNLFQILALRLMLSLPLNLCKFHFVDANSFGRKFNLINRLSNKVVGESLIDDISKINNLVTELEQAVRDANRTHLTTYSWLDEYNKNAGQLAVPYRFVFISNFPVGFNQEAAERIFNLINNQNASRAGIFIFYSIDKNIHLPYKFDFSRFTNISTYVYPNNEKDYEIENTLFDKQFNDTFDIGIDGNLPNNIEQIIARINEKANNVKPQIVSLDKHNEELIKTDRYWKGDTTKGFRVPIGFTSPVDKVFFEFGGNTVDYFAIIGGRPGYGKTVLLHNIICNGAIIYSPEELNYYLIDCTNGTGFKPYDRLPHATFVSITNKREYTLSALDNLISEMDTRADLFKSEAEKRNITIDKIEEYRSVTKGKLPRIVVIIDEFQVLLEREDKISRQAKKALEKLIREGRKYGINIILCTQSFSRLDFNTDLITLRIAFNLLEFDSLKVLRNEGAVNLRKRGEAILNNQNGNKNANIHFQGAYTDKMMDYVSFAEEKSKQLNNFNSERFVFDGKIDNDITSNKNLVKILENDTKINNLYSKIYIGVPSFIRQEHIYFKIRRNQNSNVLMVGNDMKSAITTTALVNYQLIKQSTKNSKFYIADFFSTDSPYADYFTKLQQPFDNLICVRSRDIEKIIDEIHIELSQRIEDDKNDINTAEKGRIFLSLLYIQNAKGLKKDGFNQSPTTKKLIQILKDGSDLGIHTLVYAYTYKGLLEVLDTSILNTFENKIVLYEGGSMSILTEQTTTSIEDNGYGLLQTDNQIATYNPDPFVFYNGLSTNVNNEETKFLTKIFE